MSGPSGTPQAIKGEARSVGSQLRSALFTGLALTVPIAITVFLLLFVVQFFAGFFDPVVAYLGANFDVDSDVLIAGMYLGTFLVVMLVVLLVGLAAETTSGRRIELAVSNAIERIPGIGAVYGSFNEMSEMLLESDSQSFQEVVLVEFPTEGSYAVAFLTADTPDDILDSTGHEGMRTVYMPMAPNPVMGGYVLHVSEDKVYDVDMSVEDGIQSIVTSGVAIGEEERDQLLEPDDESTSARTSDGDS